MAKQTINSGSTVDSTLGGIADLRAVINSQGAVDSTLLGLIKIKSIISNYERLTTDPSSSSSSRNWTNILFNYGQVIALSGSEVKEIRLPIFKLGSPTAIICCRVFELDENNLPTGDYILESTSFDAATLTTEATWISFEFPEYGNWQNKKYGFVFVILSGFVSTLNQIKFHNNYVSPIENPHIPILYYNNSTLIWSSSVNEQLYFEVYYNTVKANLKAIPITIIGFSSVVAVLSRYWDPDRGCYCFDSYIVRELELSTIIVREIDLDTELPHRVTCLCREN